MPSAARPVAMSGQPARGGAAGIAHCRRPANFAPAHDSCQASPPRLLRRVGPRGALLLLDEHLHAAAAAAGGLQRRALRAVGAERVGPASADAARAGAAALAAVAVPPRAGHDGDAAGHHAGARDLLCLRRRAGAVVAVGDRADRVPQLLPPRAGHLLRHAHGGAGVRRQRAGACRGPARVAAAGRPRARAARRAQAAAAAALPVQHAARDRLADALRRRHRRTHAQSAERAAAHVAAGDGQRHDQPAPRARLHRGLRRDREDPLRAPPRRELGGAAGAARRGDPGVHPAAAGRERDQARRGELLLEVEDDAPAASPARRGFGIGLANTRSRLEAIYGAGQRFELLRAGMGTVARVRLPLAGVDGQERLAA